MTGPLVWLRARLLVARVQLPATARRLYHDAADRAACAVAYRVPRRVAYWCTIRLVCHAALLDGEAEVPGITGTEALAAWQLIDERTLAAAIVADGVDAAAEADGE